MNWWNIQRLKYTDRLPSNTMRVVIKGEDGIVSYIDSTKKYLKKWYQKLLKLELVQKVNLLVG